MPHDREHRGEVRHLGGHLLELLRVTGPRVAAVLLAELLREPEHAAAECVHRVVDEVVREPAGSQRAHHRVDVAGGREAEPVPRVHDPRCPRMPQHHAARREDARAQRDLPRGIRVGHVEPARRPLDLGEHEVDDAVEDRLLVGHVVVERHRLDAELLGEAPDRECVDAAGVGEVDGGLQHPLARERRAALGARARRSVPWSTTSARPPLVLTTVQACTRVRDLPSRQPSESTLPYVVRLTT